MRHAADLQKCLQQLETAAKIESFPLADQDISDKFQIPQKLYGSEAEVAIAVMPQYGSLKTVQREKRCDKQTLRLLREDARNDKQILSEPYWVMPELEMIIDRQPDVPEFGTTEAQSGHKYFPHTGC